MQQEKNTSVNKIELFKIMTVTKITIKKRIFLKNNNLGDQMKHLIALSSKIAFTLALLYVILDRVYYASFLSVMFIALFLGFVSYLSGDMLVLPRTNNIIASLADFGLSFVMIWVFALTQTRNDFSPFAAALLSAVCLTVFEYFFHRYLLKNVLDETFRNELTTRDNTLQYQTEAADELLPDVTNEKHEE